MQYKGELKIVAGATAFAFIPVFAIYGKELGVQGLLFGRLFISSIFLYLFSKQKNNLFRLGKNEFLKLALWSIIMFLAMEFYFFAIHLSSVSISASLLGTQPLFVILLAKFWYKEKIKTISYIASFICMLGIYLICGFGDFFNKDFLWGELLAIASAFLLSVNFLFKKKYLPQYSGNDLVFYQSFFQLPIILPFVLIYPGTVTHEGIVSFVLLGLICSVFAYKMIYEGVKLVSAQKIGVLQSVEYVLPVFIGVIFYQETLNTSSIIGIILILVSSILITFFSEKLYPLKTRKS